jgi:hypothetical protein
MAGMGRRKVLGLLGGAAAWPLGRLRSRGRGRLSEAFAGITLEEKFVSL